MTVGNYKIRATDNQWIVYQVLTRGEKSKKAGEEHYHALTFHANLEQAARSLYNRMVMETMGSDAELLTLILEALAEAEARVIAVVREVSTQ